MPDAAVIAFDYGEKRTGIAIGNKITGTASPLTTIVADKTDVKWREIDQIIAQWRPAELVLGVPINVDAPTKTLLKQIKNFRKTLHSRYDLPIHQVDESYSSAEAAERLKRQRQHGSRKKLTKPEIDAQAAVIILERWLNGSQL